MKYFTPELFVRGNSTDARQVRGVEEEWEQALRRYERRWRKIRAAFPEGVRRFDEATVHLHDAEVLHLAREDQRFVMVLQPEIPAQNLVILMFTLTKDPVILTEALPDAVRTQRRLWLYEEFDRDRHNQFHFEVLLSNGWIVQLSFRDFQFLAGETIVSTTNGQTGRLTKTTATRSV